MGDDQASKENITMNKYRENLLKLIKMMEAIRQENFNDNKERYPETMTDNEAEYYIPNDKIVSIRELTRMFVKEIESEYMKCSEGDEVVRFIEDMIQWLSGAYDFIIENNACSSSVKNLKICNQSLEDYREVYEKSQLKTVVNADHGTIAYLKNKNNEFIFDKKKMDDKDNLQPINFNITFTGDVKSNEITASKLESMMKKILEKQSSRHTR
jgi:hypothetical protein